MTFIVRCAPVLKQWRFCCCSCNLRSAATVLAWFMTVACASQLVTFICYLSHPIIPPGHLEIKITLISILSSTIGSFILDVLLVYGIHNKKPVFMLPFLVLKLIGIVILTVLVFVIGVTLLATNNALFGLLAWLVGSVLVVIAAAFWIVIYSYYRQVDEEKSPNSGIVNYTYGVPDDRVQISSLEDGNALRPHAAKMVPDMA